MDVVEAKRADWKVDPFEFIEKDGYFYGRGTVDMKSGIVATTSGAAQARQAGFKPTRDIILFFTGDEETMMNGALLGSTKWRDQTDAEFALNADGGGGAYDRDGRPLGFGAADRREDLPDLFLHRPQPRRPQLAARAPTTPSTTSPAP